MLSTYLAAHPWLATALLAAVVVVGPFAGWWLARRPRAAWALAGLALLATLGATLVPSGREVETVCATDWHVRLTAPEPLANVVLLMPLALLVGVASRRPPLGALAGAGLSAAIELVQALVPALGRSCAVADWEANAVGAVLGALQAALALRLARGPGPRATADDGSAAVG